MSLSYTDAKIIEAYKLAKGNENKVIQVITLLAQQDAELLKGLTNQYMTGIIASRVRQTLSGKTEKSAVKPTKKRARPVAKAPIPQKSAATEQNDFGVEILRAASGDNAEIFGFDSGAPVSPPKQASQSHIDAIHQMAARAKTKIRF